MSRTPMAGIRSFMGAAVLLGLARLAGATPVVHLAWDDCGVAGTQTKTFSCGTNSGAQVLVLSFIPPEGITAFDALETSIQLLGQTYGPVPDYWQLATSGCRNLTPLIDQNFVGGPFHCADPWLGIAAGGAIFDAPTQRLKAIAAIPPGSEHALDPSTEYYGLRIVLRNSKTAGPGACSGCSTPIGFSVVYTRLYQSTTNSQFDFPDSTRGFGVVPYVSWQCAGTPRFYCDFRTGCTFDGWDFPGCIVATRRITWGAIKSLYR